LKEQLAKRREGVFGIAVLLAGLSIIGLCLMPLLLLDTAPKPLFPTSQQEHFFFDLFGLIFACWLLSWVSALNDWKQMAKAAQWLGVILLSIDQAVLVVVWKELPTLHSIPIGMWLAPLILQTYLIGCFLGFFTLPNLTRAKNLSLTGLGTLLLLLPWLCGRDLVIIGAEHLHGLIF
jgi:hypothetical protein